LHQASYQLPPWIGLAIMVIVCGGAFWKGQRDEQVAAGGLLLAVMATIVLRDPRWIGLQRGAFIADVCLLLLLTAVALRSQRYWPLFAAAFQLLCVFIHVARVFDPGVHSWAYATGEVIFTQWVFFAVGIGTINTWRRGRQLAIEGDPSTAPGATRR
jgi:hypothetical protein